MEKEERRRRKKRKEGIEEEEEGGWRKKKGYGPLQSANFGSAIDYRKKNDCFLHLLNVAPHKQ